ncbi:hypothetical protein [Parafrankia sp. EUN1f]|uniref:hypothetical protein n=1 Tax=Parafrankia sp. EUN1f TaxID=102897 RepID=UPI0001C46BF1|nr:hypothetical protein [Parafrankia sp. EUN1f]EFC80876.1 hypothetical protein FrEUN1fDRAFT_5978 [Parafrankia sp. EUN1f]
MATVPSSRTWGSRDKLTSLRFNEISAFLRFLDGRQGGFCELNQSLIQNVPNDTDYPIVFQDEVVDRDGGHSDLTQIGRYYAQTDGWYMVSGVIAFEVHSTGYRSAKLIRYDANSGTWVPLCAAIRPAVSAFATLVPVGSRLVQMTVGQSIELVARQTSGTTLNTTVTDGASGLSVVYVGAL